MSSSRLKLEQLNCCMFVWNDVIPKSYVQYVCRRAIIFQANSVLLRQSWNEVRVQRNSGPSV